MAISKYLFERLSDRIGYQTRSICSGLDAAKYPGGDGRYKMIHSGIDVAGDYTAENALISTANTLDLGTNLARGTHLNTCFNGVINADGTYATTLGFTDLNGYLWASGINVCPEYDLSRYSVTGSHLNAVNVFGPQISPVATVTFTGSGVGAFTAGTAVGTGTGAKSDINSAAANIEVVVCSGIGANPIHLDIFAKIEGGTSGTTENRTLTKDIASGSVGDKFLVGTMGNKGDMALSVTNVIVAGGNNGDALVIQSIMERTIQP